MSDLEARVSQLEGNYKRLSDRVEVNNTQTAEMFAVFKDIEPGFKFMSDAYSLAVRFFKWGGTAAKWITPIVILGFVIWSLATKGTVPISL